MMSTNVAVAVNTAKRCSPRLYGVETDFRRGSLGSIEGTIRLRINKSGEDESSTRPHSGCSTRNAVILSKLLRLETLIDSFAVLGRERNFLVLFAQLFMHKSESVIAGR